MRAFFFFVLDLAGGQKDKKILSTLALQVWLKGEKSTFKKESMLIYFLGINFFWFSWWYILHFYAPFGNMYVQDPHLDVEGEESMTSQLFVYIHPNLVMRLCF